MGATNPFRISSASHGQVRPSKDGIMIIYLPAEWSQDARSLSAGCFSSVS